MASHNLPSIPKKLQLLFHGIGLSTLGSALFLQTLVFTSILQNGYFKGIEQNQTILTTEIALTGFAIAYFAYIYIRFVFQNKF
jgi:hypothetical protein